MPEPEQSLHQCLQDYIETGKYHAFIQGVRRELEVCPEQVYFIEQEVELPQLWSLCIEERDIARKILHMLEIRKHKLFNSAQRHFRETHCKRKAEDDL